MTDSKTKATTRGCRPRKGKGKRVPKGEGADDSLMKLADRWDEKPKAPARGGRPRKGKGTTPKGKAPTGGDSEFEAYKTELHRRYKHAGALRDAFVARLRALSAHGPELEIVSVALVLEFVQVLKAYAATREDFGA